MSSYEKCGYYSDGECNICGMGMSGEDTFCRLCKDNPNCYYKQLSELKAENERLKKENEILLCQLVINDGEDVTVQISKSQFDKYNKYRTTLQEIKEIAETCISKDGCFECKYSDDCNIEDAEFPTYDICKLIIQKITKAEVSE